jgi:hypothetical protein
MPESNLSLKYSDLLLAVARFLGYPGDSSQWSSDQVTEVDGYVQSGVRQFYFPPAIEGVAPEFEWSFMKPTTSLDTAIGDQAQDLPDLCGRVLGDFTFEPELHARPVIAVSEHRIQAMNGHTDVQGIPQVFAVRSKNDTTKTSGQRLEVVWFPIPDKVYTLRYRYESYSGKLTEALPYPLGGMRHSETILESCLAIAEQRANDERGLHWDRFVSLLVSSMQMDRKLGARYFGQMGSPELGDRSTGQLARLDGAITYKGVPV